MEVFLHQLSECPPLYDLSIICWFRHAEDTIAILEDVVYGAGNQVKAHTTEATIFPYNDTLVFIRGSKDRHGVLTIGEVQTVNEGIELWNIITHNTKRDFLLNQTRRHIKIIQSRLSAVNN